MEFRFMPMAFETPVTVRPRNLLTRCPDTTACVKIGLFMSIVNSSKVFVIMDRETLIRENARQAHDLRGAIVVVKVGGHAMVDPAARSGIIADVVALRSLQARPVIVHGGGPEIDAMMKRTNMTPRFVAGLRVTDDQTLEIVRMVLVGNVNPDIVSLISRHGGKGVGLLGNDGDLIVARKKPLEKVVVDGKEELVDYGWVGETEQVNPAILHDLLDKGYIPVVSPIGYDRQDRCLNLNADTAAGDIAAALKAKCLEIGRAHV